ncbi:unnamed protein product [Brassica rapa subsp. trilocularis]
MIFFHIGRKQSITSLQRIIATLTCHTYRVMYVAVSPDGQTIVTGAGDETVRFWNVFPSMKTQNEALRSDQRSGFGRTASAFSSAPLDAPTADHQVRLYSLKITRISSQLKLLQKLLCLPLYMNLKGRELVYLLRVIFLRPCTHVNVKMVNF